MQEEALLLLTVSFIIWLSPYISKTLRIPTAPVEIILGSLLAYWGFLHGHEYFEIIAQVGFLYLMFLAGMEVDLKEIAKSPKSLIIRSFLFLILLGILAAILGVALDLNKLVTISLPLISIGMLAPLSKRYGKKQEWLKLAFLVGTIGEVVSIVALTIIDAASQDGLGSELFVKIALLVLIGFISYYSYRLLHILFWWFPELRHALVPKDDSQDQDVRMAIALFFILIALMLTLHLELALGTFLAGVAMSTFFHQHKELEHKMSSIGFGFLIPIFFIYVGSSFDLAALQRPSVATGALSITVMMIGMRVIASLYLKKLDDTLGALLVAFSLSMPLTLIIAVATIGFHSHMIDLTIYYQLILASLFEVLISMSAIRFLNRYKKRKEMETNS